MFQEIGMMEPSLMVPSVVESLLVEVSLEEVASVAPWLERKPSRTHLQSDNPTMNIEVTQFDKK